METKNQIKEKKCSACGRVLPIELFHRHAKAADGYMSTCDECRRRKAATPDAKGNPLAQFTARELIAELHKRGYRGELTYTQVHKINLDNF